MKWQVCLGNPLRAFMECSLNNYFKTLHPAASFSSWQLALASLLAKDWLLSTVTKFQLETGKKFIWNRMEIFEALYNSVYLLNPPNPGVQAFEWCWHALEWCWVLCLGKKIMLQIVWRPTFTHRAIDNTSTAWSSLRPKSAASLLVLRPVVPLTSLTTSVLEGNTFLKD